MALAYSKPWVGYCDQLAQLRERGLIVTDEAAALNCLERIGYYRLSGYWFPFRERTELCCPLTAEGSPRFKKGMQDKLVLDTFKPGATFQHAVDLYVFDKRLRLLALDALERIEVALRVDIAHTLGRHDPFAYLEGSLLKDDFAKKLQPNTGLTQHHQWLQNHARLIQRSKEHFIQHNKIKYGLPLAIWVACEIWDFGALSHLFAGMKPKDQDVISKKYGIAKGVVLASWLRSLAYLRNVCAHHSRLWNRNIVEQPKKPQHSEVSLFEGAWESPHTLARPFLLFCIMQHLLNTVHPNSTWWQRVRGHLLSFPELSHLNLDLDGMGIVLGWESWDWTRM